MTLDEFSELMDVHYNNITSNQAAGLNEYEKSVFLTKAQDEIIKNYFTATSKGNNTQQGFDDSAKRQADFSILMKTATCTPANISGSTLAIIKKYTCVNSVNSETSVYYGADITFTTLNGYPFSPADGTYEYSNGQISIDSGTGVLSIIRVKGFPYESGTLTIAEDEVTSTNGRIDQRSKIYAFPSDTFIIINEALADNVNKKYFQVVPLRYDEYTRLMSKPYKRPLKNQAWRLINSGNVSDGVYIKCVELITSPNYDNRNDLSYSVRYIRRPLPIIVGNLDGLKINGKEYSDVAGIGCELDPILHEDILQRAVELAKVAWTANGQDNTQVVMAAGQRSE
jgi:hypothetical protein